MGLQRSAAFTVLTFAYLVSQFLRHANAAIAHDLSTELGLTASQLGLMTSLYYVFFALAQVPIGVALDRFCPRLVVGGLMVFCVGGCLVFASAQSLAALALGRALIGLGMAGVLMGSLTILKGWYRAERFGATTSLVVGLGGVGALVAAGPLVWFAQRCGWRAVFVLAAGVVLFAACLVGYAARGRPGVLGSARDRLSIGSMGTILKEKRFWHLAPLNFFMTGVLLGFQSLWAGPLLHEALRMTSGQMGQSLSFLSIGTVAGFLLCGIVSDWLGPRVTLIVAGTVFVLSQIALIVGALGLAPLLVEVACLVFGFTGAFQLVALVQASSLYPASMTGRAVTAINFFGFAGAAVIQWLMGVIVGAFSRTAAGGYPASAYVAALIFCVVGSATAVGWYAASPGSPKEVMGI